MGLEMQSSEAVRKAPLFGVLLMLLVSLSPLALGNPLATPSDDESEFGYEIAGPPIAVTDLPALLCATDQVCPTPLRLPELPVGRPLTDGWSPGVEDWAWWFSYSPDRDSNGMDDRLQRVLAGEYESESPAAIIDENGRRTVAIHVDYAWHPGAADLSALQSILNQHNWVGPATTIEQESTGNFAFFQSWPSIDTISVDKVPLSALLDIWMLDGVVVVEQQNVMIPFLEYSVPSMKVRPSDSYSDTAHQLGFRGDGVVVAILDTGVDNEHRSLNDFDDMNDDPDLDPNSYSDAKWVAGYDATSAFSNQSGADDPDDTAGHGTHVASTAVGTGSSDRVYVGVAPGSYLVDVKVLTDAGGSNAQYTINGIQWTINNVDQDWGNNDSSEGIDVVSMSFGNVNNPNSDDPGDNGSSAEARMVDEATDAGLVCVAAMGNDGKRRVPSPASADTAISVAAIDERDTHDRTDDSHSSYSNSGPREDDGDDDDEDELKPDVAAPGTGINAATNAAGSVQFPGQPRPMADNSYNSLDGTSMATPHISGMVAVMLSKDPGLTPSEVKELIHENSEVRGTPSEPSVSDIWNDRYGFGIVDSSALISAIGGGGGNNTTTPPPSTGSGDWIDVTSPNNYSWLVAGETYRFKGTALTGQEENGTSIDEVLARATYRHENSGSGAEWRTVLDWTTAGGTYDWWVFLDVELWQDGAVGRFEVKAKDNTGVWSDLAWTTFYIGEMDISLESPSGQSDLQGTVDVTGNWKGPNIDEVQWRVGRDEWQSANFATSESMDVAGCSGSCSYRTGQWSISWDTTQHPDADYVIAARLVHNEGFYSDEIRRSVRVDNLPPAAILSVLGSISVEQYGVPVSDSLVNTFLEVRADIRNSGDAEAENVEIHLREDGSKKAEATVSSIMPGNVVEVILYWNPMAAGDRLLEVVINPPSSSSESIIFPVFERPDGVDLAIREGAIRTTPNVPRLATEYQLSVRIDNLGSHDSESAEIRLQRLTELGWLDLGSSTAATIIGSSSSEVIFIIPNGSEQRGERYRVSVTTSTDIDPYNNQREFVVVHDSVTLAAAREPSLEDSEIVLASAGLAAETLLFTNRGNSLFVHRMGSSFDIHTCLELEDDWAGDISVNAHEGVVTVVWSRQYLDDNGFSRQTVSYTTIDRTCQMTPKQDLMPGLLTSEGTYWGFDLDQYGDRVIIAGYHRDLFTGGSYSDLTGVFLIWTDSPLSAEEWSLTNNVLLNLDILPHAAPALQVELGSDDVHLMYQEIRDDSTGVERLGLFYAHGGITESNWAYSVATNTSSTIASSLGRMVVLRGGGSDVIVSAWREGDGADATLVTYITPPAWLQGVEQRTPARGLSSMTLAETERGVQILYDAVSPTGPKVHYGLLSDESHSDEMWVSDIIASGVIITASRAEDAGELRMVYATNSGVKVRSMVDDSTATSGDGGLLEWLRILLGIDSSTFDSLTKAIGVVCLVLILLTVIVVGSASRGRRSRKRSSQIEIERDYIDLDEDYESDFDDSVDVVAEHAKGESVDDEDDDGVEQAPALVAVLEEDEAEDGVEDSPVEVAEIDDEGASDRRSRRERRAVEADMKRITEDMQKMIEDSGLPPLPAPGEMPAPGELPPLPSIDDLPPPGDLPQPGELPPLPSLDDLPPPGELPPLPGSDDLPPPPGSNILPPPMDLPSPTVEAACDACEAKFSAKLNKARRVKCPICNETVRL